MLDYPSTLLALWLLPVVGWVLVHAQRRRQRAAERFADSQMLGRLLPIRRSGRWWLRFAMILAGLCLLIVAAARPRFGVFYEEVTRRSADVFVLLDVSRSMLAADVPPSRLERAKSDIRDLLTKLGGDRVGLIAFAGAAVVRVPLTTDQQFFTMELDQTDSDSAPRGGSLIGDAIRKAMSSMERLQDRDRAIVLITDGEDHDSFPEKAAEDAAAENVRIFTVGLGDPKEGARVPGKTSDAKASSRAWTRHDGQEVWSTLDEDLLQKIALTTSGAYIPAKTQVYDLGQIYEDHLAGLTRGESSSARRKQYRDQYQWFALAGLLLLVGEMLIPVWQTRSRAGVSQ